MKQKNTIFLLEKMMKLSEEGIIPPSLMVLILKRLAGGHLPRFLGRLRELPLMVPVNHVELLRSPLFEDEATPELTCHPEAAAVL